MTPAVHIDATSEELATVRDIVGRIVPGARVWVYGSRARGAAKPHSDLDLAIDAGTPLDLATLAELREAFDESELRYKVDVTDLIACEPGFAALIAGQRVELV